MRGFSLVELSIVLVILGLLTGGILAGQSLIRASELRAATSEYQRYAAAVNTFRDKYFAAPGDFRDATRFWGRQIVAAHCVSNSGIGTATATGACDGDGNGLMEDALAASEAGQRIQFWRHLALAGLIEGNYSGLAGASAVDHNPGDNCPASKLTNAGWSISSLGNTVGNASTYAMDYGNTFLVGAATGGGATNQPVLRPEEAWNIDIKLDDGRPAYGTIIARFWNNLCAAGGANEFDLANSAYKLSDNTIQCALYFRKQY